MWSKLCKQGEQVLSTSAKRVERWIKKRYGITLFFLLLVWPLVALVPLTESLVLNGLLLDDYWQLAYLTATNVVAFFFSVAILRVLNTRNPGGGISLYTFGDGELPWGQRRILVVTGLATLAPLFLALRFGTEFNHTSWLHFLWSLVAIASGAFVGVYGLWILGLIKCQIFGSQAESANYFPFESRSIKGLDCVVRFSHWLESKLKTIGLGSSDMQFLSYLLLLATVHQLTARTLENNTYWLTSAPSMLVLLIWLLFMTLAGMANFFDQVRVPPSLVLVIVLTILVSRSGSTSHLPTVPDRANNQFFKQVVETYQANRTVDDADDTIAKRQEVATDASLQPHEDIWNAISRRMRDSADEDSEKGRTLVVVTCPGGGIHAAAWSAYVLDQLSLEYVEFKDSICLISGVSGGSVGSLMFVASRYENELLNRYVVGAPGRTTEEIHKYLGEESPALELSARSSLEAIAFGTAVDDLYKLIGIPGQGRGQRLEDNLKIRLPEDVRDLTMGQWGDRAMDGRVPIVIFNSTDAVSGRRVLFDTVPTPVPTTNIGSLARPLNYRELLRTSSPNRDVLPVTAARTSASFPYISPFTKPDQPSAIGEHVAIGDGGYVDNEGIVSAVTWINFLLQMSADKNEVNPPFDRILLLRIEPSPISDIAAADSGGPLGWFRWILGPIETMFNVRSASQLERGNLEADLVKQYLNATGQNSLFDDSQVQNVVEVAEFDRRKLSPEKIRENWEQALEDFARDRSLDKLHIQNPTPAMAIPQTTTPGHPQVIIETIPFIDGNQVIPLNWKLSNKQKYGYVMAWQIHIKDGSPLRTRLDQFFTRVKEK